MTREDLLKALECCTVKRSCSGCPLFNQLDLHCSRKLLEACYDHLKEEKR